MPPRRSQEQSTDATARTRAAEQDQFLDVISRDEALARFNRHLKLAPLGIETIALDAALGRTLAADVVSAVDVAGFDRANVDGFALAAADTFEALETAPRSVLLNDEVLTPGVLPREVVQPGTATAIATGAMVPRGANAVVMIEDTDLVRDAAEPRLEIRRSVSPGQNITFAGTDIALGETVLRAGQLITAREIGVLAAVGRDRVEVFRKPRIAIISTGNEIVPPGGPCPTGSVYDSNLAIVAATVRELGGEPVPMGIVTDDETLLAEKVEAALACDAVILSGGTSKGAGDISYRVVSRYGDPGIVAHGVALKPGKPICLAVTRGKPVVILPGFPTSAIFTFHEFVAPVIRAYGGRQYHGRKTVHARLPMRIYSQRGRTEFILVGLVEGKNGLTAYPMGKGSGSVTTFSCADGFITVAAQTEILDADAHVEVQLLSASLEPAALVAIGSHCVGLDFLLGRMQQQGYPCKSLYVGSMGGLAAAKRGECDLAGIHLLDPETGRYNSPFLTDDLVLITGYRRMQSFVFRKGDRRFAGCSLDESLKRALADPTCIMVNRNAGSGTRILIDGLLAGAQPGGYAAQPKSHNAVAAAVSQGRADWGVCINTVARHYGLETIEVREECYDFVVPRTRLERPAVRAFIRLLEDPAVRGELGRMGFQLPHPDQSPQPVH